MAKVKLNPIIERITGKLENMVFRRTYGGGLSLMRKADMSRVEWSPKQVAHRERFRRAVAYAREALADPQASQVYAQRSALAGKRAFALAVSDYFKGQNLLG